MTRRSSLSSSREKVRWGTLELGSLEKYFKPCHLHYIIIIHYLSSLHNYYPLSYIISIIWFYELTMLLSRLFIADRRLVNPQLSHTNIVGLNYLLWSEIFVSEDRQLWAVHLILDFKPISRVFQDIGHAIKAGDPRINRIDVSKPTFLAKEDLPLVRLPVQQIPP